LVDDEPDILEFLGYNLIKEGYDVYKANNGKEAIKIAEEIIPHLIILDVMMPVMDGIETCRELKLIPSLNKTVIAFLTARNEDYSQISGFDAGADDYIAKPIKPYVFMGRVKALLRRYNAEDSLSDSNTININGLVINKDNYTVLNEGQKIEFRKKEFELLWLLVSRPNKVFTREEILSTVWRDTIVNEATINVHISGLRSKLGIENIKTFKGIGYKFDTGNDLEK
jgi:two-component system alkaline phosphatase synthesis response regulator PhoP